MIQEAPMTLSRQLFQLLLQFMLLRMAMQKSCYQHQKLHLITKNLCDCYISFHSFVSKWQLVWQQFDVTFNKRTIFQVYHYFCIPLIRWFLSSDTAGHFRRPHNAQTASSKSISTTAGTLLLSSHIRVTSGDTQGRSVDTHVA